MSAPDSRVVWHEAHRCIVGLSQHGADSVEGFVAPPVAVRRLALDEAELLTSVGREGSSDWFGDEVAALATQVPQQGNHRGALRRGRPQHEIAGTAHLPAPPSLKSLLVHLATLADQTRSHRRDPRAHHLAEAATPDDVRENEQPTSQPVIIGCCNLIVDDAGRYLLVKESKESALGRFNLPAGKPEVGETLIEATVREAFEETGLKVEVDHLVGLYQCPQTTEGFGVLNVVFASHVVGGMVTTSPSHPVVQYFTRNEIAAMAADGLIRGTHIELAIDDHSAGSHLPSDLIQIVPPSPSPQAR